MALIAMNMGSCVPHLDAATILLIDQAGPSSITRHFRYADLGTVLSGSFRFGTIAGYRPADTQLIGRLGDAQEGQKRDVFLSRSGSYNGKIGTQHFFDVQVSGDVEPIAVNFTVNDYCSCSSLGEFRLTRAQELRSAGNPDLRAFAIYDLNRLRETVRQIFNERSDWRKLTLIGRPVEYGKKHNSWLIPDRLPQPIATGEIDDWLNAVFVKPTEYQHEEEFRLLAVDPGDAGRLDEKADPLTIRDNRIAKCITGSGTF